MKPLTGRVRAAAGRVLGGGARIDAQLDQVRFAIGHLEARLNSLTPEHSPLRDREFKVFSQWGEDGIIQHLIRAVPIGETTFVEIGVADYRESNTRFLAMNDNWRGVIIDGGTAHQEFVEGGETGWRWDITPISAFVTAENIDSLISTAGISGDIGLLSVDVDGVDYWIWKAITAISPRIVVAEYNALFGVDQAVTVPYDPQFAAATAHHSGQYYGASLTALDLLAREKGYHLVGTGSNGVNAFFVRDDVGGSLPAVSPGDAYVEMRARTARGADGALTFESDKATLLRDLRDKPLWSVDTAETACIRDIYGV